ncbi:MAG: efflux system, outer rane lipoprotein NodT family [Betaproteobacteria bacterium]|nr:efflux system, outer rane lipoprotein NodT family [Betaproteobacteria bacterium]
MSCLFDKRTPRRLVAAVLILMSGGCSLMPTFHRPAAPVAGQFPSGDAYKYPATGPGATMLPATEIGWRDFMADPRLQRLVEIALSNNRDLRVAALNVQQMQAQYRIQRAQLLPQVSAFADAPRSRSPSSGGGGNVAQSGNVTQSYSAGLSVAWEADLFGRLGSLRDAALQQYFATGYARQGIEILLVSQVADQYLAMLAYDELLAVTQSTLKYAQEYYDLVKLQYSTGVATELTLRQSEGVVEQAQANYTAYVRLRAQAENALVLLLGQPLPADLPPVVTLNDQTLLADIPPGLPSALLTRRPDIQQAEATLRAANANIGAARAAFFPDISLTGNLGLASSTLGGLFSAGSLAWSFVPALVAPIFNGGANQANLDVAKLQKDINIATYEKTIQTAFREVADGLAARGTYDDQVASLERYVQSQQRQLDLSIMRYKSGIDSYLIVLTAQTSYYAAQQTLVTTRLNRMTSVVDLYRALGGGWIQRTGEQPRPADIAAPTAWSPTFSANKK